MSTPRRPLSRRQLLVGALATVGAAGCAPNGGTTTAGTGAVTTTSAGATGSTAGAAPVTSPVTLYSGADTNIRQLWQGALIPAFQKAFPQYPVKFVFSEHGTNDTQEYARLGASIATRKAPPADLFDTGFVNTAATAGQLAPVTAAQVPNIAKVQAPLLTPVDGAAIPYRGSSVLLAYDSTKVTNPPKTLAELLDWIRAHPGKFTYNSPSTGGSGQAFVATVLDSALPAPARATLTAKADATAEKGWDAGFATLRGLNGVVYQHVYPNGNQAVLDLLGKGQIWIAPVWSDQYLTAVGNGQLKASVKVTQISGPSFTGGAAYLGIPKNSRNVAGAAALANFVLEPAQQAAIVTTIAGFPAVPVATLPKATQAKLVGTDANNLRAGYSAGASEDLSRLWQAKVPG